MFDVDKEGVLKKNSLKTIMRNMGLKPTDQEIADMIKAGDASGKGSISFDEFLNMMGDKMKKMDSSDDIIRAFECFDPYGRGYVSVKEFNNLITTGGYAKFTDKEIRDLISMGGGDKGDGSIDYAQLVRSLTTAPS